MPFEGGAEDAGGEAGAAGDEAPCQNGGGPSPSQASPPREGGWGVLHPILTSAREAHCQRERERPPASVPCGAYIPFLGLDPAQSADYEDGLMVPVGGDELDEDGDEVGDAYGQSPEPRALFRAILGPLGIGGLCNIWGLGFCQRGG